MTQETVHKSRKRGKNPLQPLVTIEEIQAFDPNRPETFTPSPLINKVLATMIELAPANCTDVARHLDVDKRKLGGAIEIIAGMSYQKLRETWARHKVEKLKEEHPHMSGDQLAKAAGYADHSALWRADHRSLRKKEYRHNKELFNRPQEEKDREWQEFLRRRNELL